MAGGFFAAFGATACCFGPLLLVSLGAGGIWAARLRALEAYSTIFLTVTVLLLGTAFWRLYVAPRRCASGDACAKPEGLRHQRIAFWIIAVVASAMLLSPFAMPLLME